ncbi:MAG: hypothetical protein ACYDAC_00915 [Candidatus Dormibacteria bacterium]
MSKVRSRPADDLGGVPLDDVTPRRTRLRRGGPRAPLPLIPLIAALTGIGVAYVSQSAHSTQATYQATSLAAANQQLRLQDGQLGDELGRLQSSERIVAAAQQMGMRPAVSWTYLSAPLTPVVAVPSPAQLTTTSQSPHPGLLQQLVAALPGVFGLGGAAP